MKGRMKVQKIQAFAEFILERSEGLKTTIGCADLDDKSTVAPVESRESQDAGQRYVCVEPMHC
jgi:hypothetical protein